MDAQVITLGIQVRGPNGRQYQKRQHLEIVPFAGLTLIVNAEGFEYEIGPLKYDVAAAAFSCSKEISSDDLPGYLAAGWVERIVR